MSVVQAEIGQIPVAPGAESAIERFVAGEQRKRRREALTNRLLAAGFGVFVLLFWYAATALEWVHPLIIPSPIATFEATWRVMSADYYWANVWVTLQEILWGFAIGLSAGVILGVGVAMFSTVRATIYPYLVALQAPPKIVLAPSFAGKTRVQQHQIVYNALKGNMGGVLHALALQTGTP